MSNIIDELEAEQLRQIPDFGPGDTVVVQNQSSSYYSIVRDYATQIKMQDKYSSKMNKRLKY